MITAQKQHLSLPPARGGVVTWLHIGDLHMVCVGEQNFLDLQRTVAEINVLFAGQGVSFVYLPGDNADNGSKTAYQAVRECLEQLQLPWCAIVGDHDVQELSFTNFKRFMSGDLYSTFTVGTVKFLRLNCFSDPRPDSFVVDSEQLAWLEVELRQCGGLRPVVLMHCYPSDLHEGGEALTTLLRRYSVACVDMGHTHYNELSNDGHTIYCATRSTGQVEEGPVGYSVASLDGNCFSWHFKRLGTPSLLSITSPVDVRLQAQACALDAHQATPVRVLAWSLAPIRGVTLQWGSQSTALTQDSTGVWCATLPAGTLPYGEHELTAMLEDNNGQQCRDTIRVAVGVAPPAVRCETDQDNAIGAWAERDLLGTQLGPNKNGRKW